MTPMEYNYAPRLSRNELNRKRRTAEPFATPEEIKTFSRIWQDVANNAFSGKPNYSEIDLGYLMQWNDEVYGELDTHKTRLEKINDGSTFLNTALSLMRAMDATEMEAREKAMNTNASINSGHRYGLHHELAKQDRGLFWETLEQTHGVDFFAEIEQRITHLKPGESVKVLILGGDTAFFNDELRRRFGDSVDVYGTTLETAYSRIRKRDIVQKIQDKNNPLHLSEGLREYLMDTLSADIHPNDRKWRSIVQMANFPEFDMIIDTFGEIRYSSSSSEEGGARLFELTMRAALLKLQPGGNLYIADVNEDLQKGNIETYVGTAANEFEITQTHQRDFGTKQAGLAYTIHRELAI